MNEKSRVVWSEKCKLAALQKADLVKLGMLSVIVGLLYLLFHVQGNTSDISQYGRSAISWMVARWKDAGLSLGGVDHAHGFLIPIVSLVCLWYQRKQLAAASKSIDRVGLAVIIMGLLMHWVGAKGQQVRLSLMGLILIIWGVPYYLYGRQVARILVFPAAYLIFCIPLNFLDSLTFPLRLIMTKTSVFVLNGIGIGVERSGTMIVSTTGAFSPLGVDDPCSGLRSLMAMCAIAACYAYVTQRKLWKWWVLFLSAIPLAMAGNAARIITIGVVAQAIGGKTAVNLYHDFSGYVIFMLFTIPLLIALGELLNKDLKDIWRQWKLTLLSPTSPSSS